MWTWTPRYYQPNAFELALGTLEGQADVPDVVGLAARELSPHQTARSAMEEIIRECLLRPPCVVGFSGGRDSSAVLAVSSSMARREGLPLPVAVTYRFADARAQESDWQELVAKHVGITDWEIIQVGDRHDVVGDLAQQFLRSHGLIFPSTIHGSYLRLRLASGGSYLSGEGGDQIFGFHRSTIVPRLLRDPAQLKSRTYWKQLAMATGTTSTRTAVLHKVLSRANFDSREHLRPAARERVFQAIVSELIAEPFAHRRSLAWYCRQRSPVVLMEAMTALARENNVHYAAPLLTPMFVAAYARQMGYFGPRDRTEAMRMLFSDVLPEAVLCRTAKAEFTGVFITGTAREFVRLWDGEGLDNALVDAERLREAWLSDRPSSSTFGLLQAAWLHQNKVAA